MGNLPGAGLPRGYDIVGVIRIRNGLAVFLDPAADLREFLLGELLRQHKFRAVRRHQRFAVLRLIDAAQRLRVVDRRVFLHACKLVVVHKGQPHKGDRRKDRADEDEGRAPPHFPLVPVGDCAEERQHKQRQNVVQRHDNARGRLRQAELVRQNQGDRVVIGLPEGADQEKGKSDKNGTLVVELHIVFSPIS